MAAGDFAPLVGLSKYTLYEWKRRFEADGRDVWLRPELRDGEFWFAGYSCPTGTFTVHLEPGNASLGLGQLEGVRIAPDAPPDPRLMPWDLRAAVNFVDLHLPGRFGIAVLRDVAPRIDLL